MDRIITEEELVEDSFEKNIRPDNLSEYVGQSEVKENLEEAIKYFNLAIDENDNYDSAYEGRNQAMLENHVNILDLQDTLIRQKLF